MYINKICVENFSSILFTHDIFLVIPRKFSQSGDSPNRAIKPINLLRRGAIGLKIRPERPESPPKGQPPCPALPEPRAAALVSPSPPYIPVRHNNNAKQRRGRGQCRPARGRTMGLQVVAGRSLPSRGVQEVWGRGGGGGDEGRARLSESFPLRPCRGTRRGRRGRPKGRGAAAGRIIVADKREVCGRPSSRLRDWPPEVVITLQEAAASPRGSVAPFRG